jgi:hypothetical protein
LGAAIDWAETAAELTILPSFILATGLLSLFISDFVDRPFRRRLRAAGVALATPGSARSRSS